MQMYDLFQLNFHYYKVIIRKDYDMKWKEGADSEPKGT